MSLSTLSPYSSPAQPLSSVSFPPPPNTQRGQVVSAIFSTPVDVVKTRLMAQAGGGKTELSVTYNGVLDCFMRMPKAIENENRERNKAHAHTHARSLPMSHTRSFFPYVTPRFDYISPTFHTHTSTRPFSAYATPHFVYISFVYISPTCLLFV